MNISDEKQKEATELLKELEETFEVRGYLHPNELGMLWTLKWLLEDGPKPEIK